LPLFKVATFPFLRPIDFSLVVVCYVEKCDEDALEDSALGVYLDVELPEKVA